MHFLLLNQTFYPDVASTAQHLTDAALALVERGHQVTVIASRRAYDDPAVRFAAQETWRGIRIIRIAGTGFGKRSKWRRAADFVSFLLLCCFRLAFVRRPDVIVALTSPPLISVLGAWFAWLRRARFIYWVMDLNPDEAIAAGWVNAGSLTAKVLERFSRFSLRQADRVIALDRFMKQRIAGKGISADKIAVVPPWSHDTEVRFDPVGRERFRAAHGLDGKFVVMYSGNHSPCHPLDTLLSAAEKLEDERDIVFCFIGGGSEWRRIRERAGAQAWGERAEEQRGRDEKAAGREWGPHQSINPRIHQANLLPLPYQPLAEVSASLSAADLHVVVMGDAFVGLVHPCKIYNVLRIAAPVLYIGPERSALTELTATANGELTFMSARHGDAHSIVTQIRQLRARAQSSMRAVPGIAATFSQATLLPRLIAELESG